MTGGDKCSRCNKCLKKKVANENVNSWTDFEKTVQRRPKWKQHLVFDIDEDDKPQYEPYMSPLKKFFSDASIACDSNIELPWKNINIPDRIRIRSDHLVSVDQLEDEDEVPKEVEKEKSDSNVLLPWGKILVTKTVPIKVNIIVDADVNKTIEINCNQLCREPRC